MKIAFTKPLLFLLLGIYLFANINANHHRKQRPDLQDLQGQMKNIKALIEKPFIPQEVDKLSDTIKKREYADDNMTNAIIAGPKNPPQHTEEEHPVIYNTVIPGRSTSVSHPVVQPSGMKVPGSSLEAFKVNTEMIRNGGAQVEPGSYSIPVKIQSVNINDATLSNYFTPNFFQTKEKEKEQQIIMSDPQTLMKSTVEKDTMQFVSQIEGKTSREEKVKILIEGKERLKKEQRDLQNKIMTVTKDLLLAKEAAIQLDQILEIYNLKLRNNEISQFKLADEILMKKVLTSKLLKEIQGFRTGQTEFPELEKVNPNDIQNVILQVQSKTGNN